MSSNVRGRQAGRGQHEGRNRPWECVWAERDRVRPELVDAFLAAETPELLAERRRDVHELRLARLKAAHQRRLRAKADEKRRGSGQFFLA